MIADQRLDQRVPRNYPGNNCETHFGPSPRLVSKVDKGRSREKSYNVGGGGGGGWGGGGGGQLRWLTAKVLHLSSF